MGGMTHIDDEIVNTHTSAGRPVFLAVRQRQVSPTGQGDILVYDSASLELLASFPLATVDDDPSFYDLLPEALDLGIKGWAAAAAAPYFDEWPPKG